MKNRSLILLASALLLASCARSSSLPSSLDSSLPDSSQTSSDGKTSSTQTSSAATSSGATSTAGSSATSSAGSSGGSSSSVPLSPDATTYWSGITLDGSVYGSTLRDAFQTRMKKSSTNTSYGTLKTILLKSDTAGGTKCLAFYHEHKETDGVWQSGSSGTINREHTWPNSRGAGESGACAGTDPQVIRPTLVSDNSGRGNKMYTVSGDGGWDPASLGFEGARGESARIILYAAVRWHNLSQNSSGTMELTNNAGDSASNSTMGKLSSLLEWNRTYPVTVAEAYRNNYLAGSISGSPYSYCRNPFIDNPSWADYIWDAKGVRTSAPVVSSEYLSFAKTSLSLAVGASETVIATPTGYAPTTWNVTSSVPGVASASVTSGSVAVSALSEGTSVITVTGSDGTTSKSASLTVTVNDPSNMWSLVTSASSLSAGKKYLIASSGSAGSAQFLSTSITGTYYQGITEGTVTSSLSVAPTSSMEQLVLGGTEGSWTLSTSVRTSNAGYLGCSGTQYTNLVSSNDSALYKNWSISIASGGASSIRNTSIASSYKRYMEYYASKSEFTTYTDEAQVVYLYSKAA